MDKDELVSYMRYVNFDIFFNEDKYTVMAKEFDYTLEEFMAFEVYTYITNLNLSMLQVLMSDSSTREMLNRTDRFIYHLNTALEKLNIDQTYPPEVYFTYDFETPDVWYNPVFRSCSIGKRLYDFDQSIEQQYKVGHIRAPRLGANVGNWSAIPGESEWLVSAGETLEHIDTYIGPYGTINNVFVPTDKESSMDPREQQFTVTETALMDLSKCEITDFGELVGPNVPDLAHFIMTDCNKFGRSVLQQLVTSMDFYYVFNYMYYFPRPLDDRRFLYDYTRVNSLIRSAMDELSDDDLSQELCHVTNDGDTLLTLAIKSGNIELVREIWGMSPKDNIDGYSRSVDFNLCMKFDYQYISDLVSFDLSEVDMFGRTWLYYNPLLEEDPDVPIYIDTLKGPVLHHIDTYHTKPFPINKVALKTDKKHEDIYGMTPYEYRRQRHWEYDIATTYSLLE